MLDAAETRLESSDEFQPSMYRAVLGVPSFVHSSKRSTPSMSLSSLPPSTFLKIDPLSYTAAFATTASATTYCSGFLVAREEVLAGR